MRLAVLVEDGHQVLELPHALVQFLDDHSLLATPRLEPEDAPDDGADEYEGGEHQKHCALLAVRAAPSDRRQGRDGEYFQHIVPNPGLHEDERVAPPGDTLARMAAESRKAVIAAIIGNAAIAVIKFVAGSITGSSAMISEGIHSLVDTGNGGLLFHGLRRGARPADEHHPFGHGMEVYFWSLIVAVSIFGIGGGMSIYEGIIHIQHPAPLESPIINYIVLAVAVVFESISFSVAWKAFGTTKGSRRVLSAIHHGKDPSMFTVLFEDTAALLGLGVAFIGVFLSHQLEEPFIDGLASVIIGCILVCAAGWLAYESRSLLVGEGADPELVAAVRAIALADPAVVGLGAVLTMHLGPEDVLLNIEVRFTPGLPAEDIHAAVHRIEERIAEPHPEVNRIFIEVDVAGPAVLGSSETAPTEPPAGASRAEKR